MDNYFNSYFKEAEFKEVNINFFRDQVKNTEHMDLKGNIVILADRLYFLAVELFSNMQSTTNANMVNLISSTNDIKSRDYQNIDYLIIVGYLENEKNYDVINMLRRQNRNLKTVQWAILDDCIYSLCLKYKINFQFDRVKPVSEFINYLCEIKDQHDVK